jgi:hypothetical protein
MSKYLTTVVETYRVDSEAEVEIMLEQAKSDNMYILVKYTSEKKERKQKGEIIDSWYKVSLYKAFNDEKDPYDIVNVRYEV